MITQALKVEFIDLHSAMAPHHCTDAQHEAGLRQWAELERQAGCKVTENQVADWCDELYYARGV